KRDWSSDVCSSDLITTVPRLTASGTNFSDTEPPAEKNAISIPSKLSGFASSTVSSWFSNESFLPAEREEDNNLISPILNGFSSRKLMIFCPTAPVAPTTATLYFLYVEI